MCGCQSASIGASMQKYTARLSQDENGSWLGVVDLHNGHCAMSDGHSLAEARIRVRQALSVMLKQRGGSFMLEYVVEATAPSAGGRNGGGAS